MALIFIPQSRKAAAMAAILTGAFFGLLLLIAGICFVQATIKQNTWISVEATVTDYDVSDSHNVWTEFSYEIDGERYIEKHSGHSYWMKTDSSENILCSPNNPKNFVFAGQVMSTAKIMVIISLVFGGVWLLYLISYIYWRHKDPKVLPDT